MLIGKNVLVATASSTDRSLLRYSCVTSTQLNSTNWKKMSFCMFFNYEFREALLSDTFQFLKGDNVLDAATSNIHGYLWRDTFLLHPI
jgi:hypothetical protein